MMNPVTSKPPAPSLPPIERLIQLSDEVCAALRARLASSGYSPALVAEAEAVAPGQLDAVRLPLVHWWLERKGGTGAALARLFCYLSSLTRAEAEEALTAPVLGALETVGVLRERGVEIESNFRLTPLEGLFVISDSPDAAEDAAMGPGITTLNLVRLIPSAPGTLLDVGCGAGTLALLAAARGSPHAVGVDVNERAVSLSRFNARLNGVPAQFHAGDLLEPVRGERFELLLSQPPYVVQPEGIDRTLYLHGGSRGDEMALRFAVEMAKALAPGGRALLLFDTAPAKEPLHRRLRKALGDAPVDLVALLAPGLSADMHALGYASLEDAALGDRYREALRSYREHIEGLGGGAFSRALVVLDASDRAGGRFDVQLPITGLGRLDADRLGIFLSGLALAGADDGRVLTASVRLAPEGRLVEERTAGHLREEPARSVRFEKGALAVDREISEAGFFLFSALEECATVAEAVSRFAEACEEPPNEVRQTVLDFVREGLSRSLLVPLM
jgi:SAM-dependent methyltransferase